MRIYQITFRSGDIGGWVTKYIEAATKDEAQDKARAIFADKIERTISLVIEVSEIKLEEKPE